MNRALLHMHLAVLLWGFTGVLGRAISVDAPALVWWRMLLTAAMMVVIVAVRKEWQPVPRKDRAMLAIIGSLIGLHWIAFYAAIKFSNASIALICLSTAPVFTAVLDPLVNKTRWTPAEIGIGAVGLLGIYFIYRYEFAFGEGIAFGVVAALLSSVFTVLNKRIAARYPPRLMVLYEMATGWVLVSIFIAVLLLCGFQKFLIPATDARETLVFWPQGMDWLWLPILALCCTVWAQSLALSALKKLSSFTVTLSVNLEPVYGIVLAFVCYQENELFGSGFYLGVALIVLSVLLQIFRLKRPVPGVQERGGID